MPSTPRSRKVAKPEASGRAKREASGADGTGAHVPLPRPPADGSPPRGSLDNRPPMVSAPAAARTLAAARGPRSFVTAADFLERRLDRARTVRDQIRLLWAYTAAAVTLMLSAATAIIGIGLMLGSVLSPTAVTVAFSIATSAAAAAFGIRRATQKQTSAQYADEQAGDGPPAA